VKVKEVCRRLEKLAPPGYAYPWDRSGLRIGSPQIEVSRVLVALTVTSEAFAAARKAKAELIVAHHPPLWDPLEVLRTDNRETQLWLEIAQAGLACYAAHTNLDIAPGGVNDALADRLDLEQRAPLFQTPHVALVKLVTFVPEAHLGPVREAVCEAGAGEIGEYRHCSFSSPGTGTFLPGDKAQPFAGKRHVVNEEPERRLEVQLHEARLSQVLAALKRAHPYEEVAYDVYPMNNPDPYIGLGVRGKLAEAVTANELAAIVRKALDIQHVRLVAKSKRKIRSVGVMGGAGSSQIHKLPRGIDAFITGDVTYHDAQAGYDRGIAVIDAGHHGTEKWIVPQLAAYLKKRLESVKVSTFMEPDPFYAVTE